MATKQTRYIFWCPKCGVPLLQPECGNCGYKGIKTVSDLKPMFEEEKGFIEACVGEQLPEETVLLWIRQKTIWYNGQRYMRLSADGKLQVVKRYLTAQDSSLPDVKPTVEVLRRANAESLRKLEDEAINFIKEVVTAHPERLPVVSFSGGKDSTVVSYLVRQALVKDPVLHIFGDTTLEYPHTYEFLDAFQQSDPNIDLRFACSDQDFFELCEALQVPTRIIRWCCSVFKTSPMAQTMHELGGGRPILSFEGIRRSESSGRSKHKRIYKSKKISIQLSAEPILYWPELAVWLCIFAHGLPINRGYELGFSRVGCMYCPNNTPTESLLFSYYYPQLYSQWRSFLIQIARDRGKSDPSEYVDSGSWKSAVGQYRTGTRSKIEVKECTDGSNILNFVLSRNFSKDLSEFLKPFGAVKAVPSRMGGDCFLIENADVGGALMVEGVDAFPRAQVTFMGAYNTHLIRRRVGHQLRRFCSCIGCGACAGACPTGAIKVASPYQIDSSLCTNCGLCTHAKFIDGGCVALKVRV